MKHQETVREFYRRQGEERERKRIIELLNNPYFHYIQSPDQHITCEMCKVIERIKNENRQPV
jgi:hypothetical protein